MDKNQEMYNLGVRAWEHRRKNGFSKSFPEEIKVGSAALITDGVSLRQMAKVLGITKTTMQEWRDRYGKKKTNSEVIGFCEVAVVEDKAKYEVRLSATVMDCRVELSGTDYSLLQRLLRKLGS